MLTECGFQVTGIDEVLRRVGVPKGPFYHFFLSKRAFGEAAIRNHVDYYARKTGWIFDSPERSPLDRLRVFVNDARVQEIQPPYSPCAPVSTRPTSNRAVFAENHARAWILQALRRAESPHAEARTLLDTTLKDCERFLGCVTEGWFRNDLAVTLHKLKVLPTCREALQPLAANAASKGAQIHEDYAPTHAEIHLPVVKAARTNMRHLAAPC